MTLGTKSNFPAETAPEVIIKSIFDFGFSDIPTFLLCSLINLIVLEFHLDQLNDHFHIHRMQASHHQGQ